MKKWVALLAALLMIAVAALAGAEGSSSLSSFSDRLINKVNNTQSGVQESVDAEAVPDVSYGPAVLVNDPFFQKVRSSAYVTEDKYGTEANVMIELKNVSGRTLYPDDVKITAYNAEGEAIAEETYAYVGPDMVSADGSLFVWDWFYHSFDSVADLDHFEVTVETETSSYYKYEEIAAQGIVVNGVGYAVIENATDAEIYGLNATICVENEEGVLLDVCEVNSGNAIGVFPGSVMVLRDNVKDYANDTALQDGIVTVHAIYRVE